MTHETVRREDLPPHLQAKLPIPPRLEPPSSGGVAVFLAVLALLFAIGAFVADSIGGVAFGCLLGILARLAQASYQHKQIVHALRARATDRSG